MMKFQTNHNFEVIVLLSLGFSLLLLSTIEISRTELKSFLHPKPTQRNAFRERNVNEVDRVIDIARVKINREMHACNNTIQNNGNDSEILFMEKGGRPMRTIVISRCRTGSSFLGKLISSRSPTFYSYEPINRLGTTRLNGSKLSEALDDIRLLMMCDLFKLKKYFNFLHRKRLMLERNTLWSYCMYQRELCDSAEFASKLCQLFPLQSIKTTRLYLHQIQGLLEDEKFNLRAVVLVRDPRAVMNSRWKLGWCLNSDECWRTASYCEDLLSEYRDVQRMAAKYPGKISVVRYEDLAMEPENNTRKLFKSIGIAMSPSVEDFVKLHTKHQMDGAYSLFRKSSDVPFHWIQEMKFDVIEDIQNTCKEPMSLWGYQSAKNESQLKSKSFRPVVGYTSPIL